MFRKHSNGPTHYPSCDNHIPIIQCKKFLMFECFSQSPRTWDHCLVETPVLVSHFFVKKRETLKTSVISLPCFGADFSDGAIPLNSRIEGFLCGQFFHESKHERRLSCSPLFWLMKMMIIRLYKNEWRIFRCKRISNWWGERSSIFIHLTCLHNVERVLVADKIGEVL